MSRPTTLRASRSTIVLNKVKTFFSKPHNVILLLLGIVLTFTTVAPIVAIVQDTFKIHAGTIDAHLTGQASGYTLVNYIDLFTSRLAMSNLWMPLINTVLLAVASGDGKLVVVASGNSEDWLRNSKTMDALSEAATDKLAKSGAQDWSGAAIAMMDQIMLLKKTSTSGSLSKIAVIVLMCVVVVLIVGTIVFVVLRNRRRRKEAELDAARAAAGKRTRANRRGHAVGHAAESASRSRGRRGEEHGRRRRVKRSDESVESADVAKSDADKAGIEAASVTEGAAEPAMVSADASADDSAKFMPVSDQVEQSEMAGPTESTGPAESTEPVEPTGQPVAQRMEFPEATPEAGAAERTETQPVETPAGDESEPKKHSGFHLFGKGGKGGKGGAKGASADPLFHAGDSFMPGDGSVDQSVSDDIESMFARPFIPGTQRPSSENNENNENKD